LTARTWPKTPTGSSYHLGPGGTTLQCRGIEEIGKWDGRGREEKEYYNL